MALDPQVVDDMKQSYSAIKKGKGLEFYVIPAKDPGSSPWVLIDKSAKIRSRFMKATKELNRLGYAKARAVGGRVQMDGDKLLFVVEEPDESLEGLIRGRWSSLLKKEDDRDVSRLGAILKRVSVVSEADAGQAGGAAGGPEALGPEELAGLLGDDGAEALAALPQLAALDGRLADAPREPAPPGEDAVKLLAALKGADASKLAAVIPAFLKMAMSGPPRSSAPLAPGQALPPADGAVALAASMNAYLRSLIAWEALQTQAYTLQGDVDGLLARRGSLEEGDVETLDLLIAQYNGARVRTVQAEERSSALRRALESELAAIQRAL